jgi:threonine aldolase
VIVDLRSDTVTRPSPAMRAAMAAAEVGDDVFGEDPEVNALEAEVAALLGKEAALFVPTGTMANQIAFSVHTRPGDEVVCEASAHPLHHEAGAPAWLSGVTVRGVPGERGLLPVDGAAACFRPDNVHFSPVRLICAEDTSNRGGGTVYPLDLLDALGELATARGVAAHLDGARLMNAVVASGVPAARRVRAFDTVSLCLSKGLGAPVGSLLAGPAALIHRGRRVRKAFGGGMRQAGVLAAAGRYALRHHVDRLADDHRRATALADGLRAIGLEVRPPATNMVYVEVPDAAAAVPALESRGLRCLAVSARELRLVLHLDVDDAGLMAALDAFRAVYG